MRVRSVFASLGVVAFVGVGLHAWLDYFAGSDLVTAIGLPGPSADVGTRCGHWARRYGRFHVPTRRVTCSRQRAMLWPRRFDEQRVEVDLLTRRVESATRSWTPTDSLTWQQTVDSVRVAVRQRGGLPLPCTRPERTISNIELMEHWRVGDHTERLIVYHWTPENSLNGEWRWQPWMLQLDAYAGGPPDCAETRGQAA